MVFVSDAEGCGLPPLEALFAGCPVIVSDNLPALEGLSESGQIRLAEVTVENVRVAVETLADPSHNARYRLAISALQLPTWKQFARTIEGWIANGQTYRGNAGQIVELARAESPRKP
jgi:glycosyltransferase involved in cell wall biosynthesis